MNSKLQLINKFFKTLRDEGFEKTIHKTNNYIFNDIFIYIIINKINIHPQHSKKISLLRRLFPITWIARKRAYNFVHKPLSKTQEIGEDLVLLHKKQDKFLESDKVVILAHWDPQNKIDAYVKNMCLHFKNIGKKVIISSANHIDCLSDIKEYADAALYRKCPGYDFTSWKAAFTAIPSLFECEEVTICNDSVFAPVGSYAPVYESMRKVNCDFWGMTFSRQIVPHLQSFHVVFRKKALRHPALKQFFEAVPCATDRENAIGFEIRLALWLELNGLQAGAFLILPWYTSQINPSINLYKKLLQWGCPLIKRQIIMEKNITKEYQNILKILTAKGYKTELIDNYLERTKLTCGSLRKEQPDA